MVLCSLSSGEDDLQEVRTELRDINRVVELGLSLGLRMSAIERIQADHPQSVEDQKTRILYAWLKGVDIVSSKQSSLPTWSEIANAVANENKTLSRTIRRKYCPMSS